MELSKILNDLYTFYLHDGGWFWFLLSPLLVLLIIVIDNQLRQRRAGLWMILTTICVLFFVPTMINEFSPDTLSNQPELIFQIGIVGAIVPPFLLLAYLISHREPYIPNLPGEINPDISRLVTAPEAGTYIPNQQFSYPPAEQGYTQAPNPNANYPQPYGTVQGSPMGYPQPYPAMPGQPPPFAPSPNFQSPPNAYSADDDKTVLPSDLTMGLPREYSNTYLQDQRGQKHRLFMARTVIGRDEKADIRFIEAFVSRYHAIIERREGNSFVIWDNGSSGGTYVNGYRLGQQEIQLDPGSEIVLGLPEWKGPTLKFISGMS